MNWYTRIITARTSRGACTAVWIALAGFTIFQSSAFAQAEKSKKALEKSDQIRRLESLVKKDQAEIIMLEVEDKPIIISDGSLSIFSVSGFAKWARCPTNDGGEDLLPPQHVLGTEQIYYDDEGLNQGSICSVGTSCTVSVNYGGIPDAIVIVKAANTLVKIHTKVRFSAPIKGAVRHWESLAHPDDASHIQNVSVQAGPSYPAPGFGKIPALGIDMFFNPAGVKPTCP